MGIFVFFDKMRCPGGVVFDKNFGQNVKILTPARPHPLPRDDIDRCKSKTFFYKAKLSFQPSVTGQQ